jgi:hypothetical protein
MGALTRVGRDKLLIVLLSATPLLGTITRDFRNRDLDASRNWGPRLGEGGLECGIGPSSLLRMIDRKQNVPVCDRLIQRLLK